MATEITSEGLVDITERPMTPAEVRHLRALEGRIERGLHTFREVGAALMEVRDQRLYRLEHATFEDYCRSKWDLDRVRAYQLIGAAEVVKVLGSGDKEGPVNEAQARELVPILHDLGPTVVQEVWRDVEKLDRPVTAAIVREAIRARVEPEAPAAPTPTERFVSLTNRLVLEYARWQKTKPSRREKAIVAGAIAKLNEVFPAKE